MLRVIMSGPIDEPTFERLADQTLKKMVDGLADSEDDAFDADLESGVLTIKFEDGARYVVNSHRAARQIWMAADASAWHFEWDGQRWKSTKGPEELWSLLADRVSKRIGRAFVLRP
jgi:CyaY protein